MIRTNKIDSENKILIDSEELMRYMTCGRTTAEKIAREAGAIVRIGKRKLYSVKKLDEYIYSITGNE